MRRAAKIDRNQVEMVKQLRAIYGVTVAVGHDDIFVGYQGNNYWYEIKAPEKRKRLQPSQKKLQENWAGHYKVVSTLEEILDDLGISISA